jgi:hypothetical protein
MQRVMSKLMTKKKAAIKEKEMRKPPNERR